MTNCNAHIPFLSLALQVSKEMLSLLQSSQSQHSSCAQYLFLLQPVQEIPKFNTVRDEQCFGQ